MPFLMKMGRRLSLGFSNENKERRVADLNASTDPHISPTLEEDHGHLLVMMVSCGSIVITAEIVPVKIKSRALALGDSLSVSQSAANGGKNLPYHAYHTITYFAITYNKSYN